MRKTVRECISLADKMINRLLNSTNPQKKILKYLPVMSTNCPKLFLCYIFGPFWKNERTFAIDNSTRAQIVLSFANKNANLSLVKKKNCRGFFWFLRYEIWIIFLTLSHVGKFFHLKNFSVHLFFCKIQKHPSLRRFNFF